MYTAPKPRFKTHAYTAPLQPQQRGSENIIPRVYFVRATRIANDALFSFCTRARQTISRHLRHSRPGMISLLDVTLSGISTLPADFLEDVALHGLVVSTGELRRVNENAFTKLARPLQALGLPNNLLDAVPVVALAKLVGLERLDLSHNKLKTLEANSFQVCFRKLFLLVIKLIKCWRIRRVFFLI